MPAPVWAWVCAGACSGGLVALLVFAPARWLAWAVHQSSSGHLQLSQTRGTVWAGSAQLALTGSSGSRDAVRLPSRVQWQIRAGWDRLEIQLQAACCTPQPVVLMATPHWRSVRLRVEDGASAWPARILSGLGAPWNTVQLEGELLVMSKGLTARLSTEHLAFEGQLQIDARDLRSPLSSVQPMGSYRITLDGGIKPSLQLTTLSGSLQLSGQGRWTGWHLRFDGTASAAPAQEAELSNLLNLIGRRDGARSILTVG